MLFPTPSFAIFFVAVFIGGWMVFTGRTSWRVFVLLASYVFYAFFDPWFLVLFLAATGIGWLCTREIAARGPGTAAARLVMGLGVAAHVAVLIWFKLFGFFSASAQTLLTTLGVDATWTVLQVVIPVGISFLMFRGIAAIVDVYRGDAEAPELLDYALFMAFFPYVAAGPIVRLAEVVPQWAARCEPSRLAATQGFLLIAGGLVKKMLVADYLARVAVDEVFAAPHLFGSADVLAGVYAYAAQIYCDFSGYTDMAIGIALLLGITLPLNFDSPYAARSLQTFWRSWHMTLSRFLRDYVYIPLGGNRRGTFRTYLNLILTMVIGGLWHGAGLTFIIWGLLHGVGLVVERAAKGWSAMRERVAIPAPLAWFLTFQFVCVAWVFFRADSVGTALAVLGRSFTAWDVPATLPAAVWVLVAAVVAVQFVPPTVRESLRDTFWALRPVAQAAALALVLFVVSALSPEGPAAFIYAGF